MILECRTKNSSDELVWRLEPWTLSEGVFGDPRPGIFKALILLVLLYTSSCLLQQALSYGVQLAGLYVQLTIAPSDRCRSCYSHNPASPAQPIPHDPLLQFPEVHPALKVSSSKGTVRCIDLPDDLKSHGLCTSTKLVTRNLRGAEPLLREIIVSKSKTWMRRDTLKRWP